MKKYRELGFTDDFIFCKIMSTNLGLCQQILALILKKNIKNISIRGTQQAIDLTAAGKGIRMDVYLNDTEGTLYDIEMQASKKKYLPKRLRYYQSMLDLNQLEKGGDYGELPGTIIIFICTFDYFGKGLPTYTFESRCAEQPNLHMGDGTQKLYINPDSNREGLGKDFNAFLDYLQGKVSENRLIKEIEEAVKKARVQKEWEVEYMTWQAYEMDARREGREEGLEVGRTEGIIKSGRRHAFSDPIIISDIVEEIGCDFEKAKQLLENYDKAAR